MTDRLTYKQDLTHCGLKKTRHRLVILDILDHSDQPVTAEQIFARLQDRRIAINLSTVYRTLDTLVLNKLVTRLSITQDGRALHEYNRRVHRHYLVCQGCRKIIPIDGCPLADYSRQLEQETGFQISGLSPAAACPTEERRTRQARAENIFIAPSGQSICENRAANGWRSKRRGRLVIGAVKCLY